MKNSYKVNKSFYINPSNTINQVVLDDFGINREYETVNINIEIPNDFDVLYITGESGSGKSVIMRELFEETKLDKETFLSSPIIDMGENVEETIRVLSMFGLGDAALFSLKPSQLSDSQYKRAEIAKMVIDGNDFIVIDEFLSTLDRDTAKSVAYNIQKNFRKLGIKLVAVTAHDDLAEYLQPDVVVKGKSFPSRFLVEKCSIKPHNPFLERLVLYKGDKGDYKEERLGEIHYKGKYSGGKQEYFFVKMNDNVIGVLVTNNQISSKSRRISRVVIHPTYRGVGLAQELIKYCIEETEGDVDALAAMAKYNPFFEKAGMTRVDDVKIKAPSGLKTELKQLSFNFTRWWDIQYCKDFCEEVSHREMLSNFSKYTNTLIQPGGKKLSEEERKQMILNDAKTCGRILWSFREKSMAKYVAK